MSWFILILSGLMETVWASALAHSDGFRNTKMVIVFLIAMVASMAGLGLALKDLPIGTAYAVWTGIGAVGTAAVGMILFGDPVSVGRIVCLVLIVSGIVGLKVLN
ncbi:MAG: multidrug efflux SMR transporter [Propionibacterium sp.]|nr:multidrug efflux SMR transporter [Propionibacterium sp.]